MDRIDRECAQLNRSCGGKHRERPCEVHLIFMRPSPIGVLVSILARGCSAAALNGSGIAATSQPSTCCTGSCRLPLHFLFVGKVSAESFLGLPGDGAVFSYTTQRAQISVPKANGSSGGEQVVISQMVAIKARLSDVRHRKGSLPLTAF